MPELLVSGPKEDLEEKERVAVRYGTEASIYKKKGFIEL